MTPQQFCDWLDGVLDADEINELESKIDPGMRELIQRRLGSVEREVAAPAPAKSTAVISRNAKEHQEGVARSSFDEVFERLTKSSRGGPIGPMSHPYVLGEATPGVLGVAMPSVGTSVTSVVGLDKDSPF